MNIVVLFSFKKYETLIFIDIYQRQGYVILFYCSYSLYNIKNVVKVK